MVAAVAYPSQMIMGLSASSDSADGEESTLHRSVGEEALGAVLKDELQGLNVAVSVLEGDDEFLLVEVGEGVVVELDLAESWYLLNLQVREVAVWGVLGFLPDLACVCDGSGLLLEELCLELFPAFL